MSDQIVWCPRCHSKGAEVQMELKENSGVDVRFTVAEEPVARAADIWECAQCLHTRFGTISAAAGAATRSKGAA